MSIHYKTFNDIPLDQADSVLNEIKEIVSKDLSESYSLYVFRYFIHRSPELCIIAYDGDQIVGVIVCDLSGYRARRLRGYIAMLAVITSYRGKGIAKQLISKAVTKMKSSSADEIVLEVEAVNDIAMNLYEGIGFMRSKRLHHHYRNANDAFRLILPLTEKSGILTKFLPSEEHLMIPV